MAYFVSAVGGLIVIMSVYGIASPQTLVELIMGMRSPVRFRVAVLTRLVLGVGFIVAAPLCRIPIFVYVFGGLSLLAAAVILGLGSRRLDIFIEPWLARPPTFLRLMCFLGVVLGGALVYAGA